jgi:hypothetical protein
MLMMRFKKGDVSQPKISITALISLLLMKLEVAF